MKKVALLPIRSNSKRIERKNFREVLGIPLFYVVLAQIVASEVYDKVVLAIEPCEKLPEALLNDERVQIYYRSEGSAQDCATSEDILMEVSNSLKMKDQDFIYLFQATNPFLRLKYLKYATDDEHLSNHDSVISVVESRRFYLDEVRSKDFLREQTQSRQPRLMETGNLWGTQIRVLNENFSRIGRNPLLVAIDEVDDHDIDELPDFDFLVSPIEEFLGSQPKLIKVIQDWLPDVARVATSQIMTKASMKATVNALFISELENIAKRIVVSFKNGGKVVFFGNGGSAADSQHIAAEFVSKLKTDRIPLPAISLTTDTSAITAIGNDYGFEFLFSRQVEAIVSKEDVVIGITTSGSSENVLKGLDMAKYKGATTVILTSNQYNDTNKYDYCLKVESASTATIQELHIQIGHILCALSEYEYV